MEKPIIKIALIVLCLASVAIVPAATTGQSETPSVWDRIQKVEDPELGELIRAAMKDHWEPSKADTLRIIRQVTRSYAQIKLLDQQVLQVSQKLEAARGPAEMRYELLLAKAELEAKLMSELTDLREMLGVIPKYPLDKQPVPGLATWLRLNAIDGDRVYVLDTVKPLVDDWTRARFESVGLMSQDDVLEWVRGRLRDPANLPVRVDIVWKNDAAEKLRDRVVTLVKEMNVQMEADVRLGRNSFIGSGECPIYLRQGTITTFYPAPVQSPKGPSGDFLVNGRVDPEEIEKHIAWRITYQWNLPLTFRIEHDLASADLAQRIVEQIRATAKPLGVGDLVSIKTIPVDPLPKTAFVGQWRAITNSHVREITIDARGQSELHMERQPDGSGEPTVMSAPWYQTSEEILVDLNRVYNMGHRYVYRGRLDKEGHLILDTGLIECQGSFGFSGRTPMVFEQVR